MSSGNRQRTNSQSRLQSSRRRAFIKSVGVGGVAALAGCAGSNNESEGESDGGSGTETAGATTGGSDSVTLELIWFNGQATEENLSAYDDAIAAFEESTGHTVDVTKTGQVGQIVNQVQTGVQAGDPVSIAAIPAGACQTLANKEIIEPLDSYIDDADTFSRSDIIRGKLDISTRDDTTYAVPIMSGHWGSLFYNANMLEQAGYDPMNPDFETWPEFISVAEDVKEAVGVQPVGFSGADHIHTTVQWSGFFHTTGRKSWLNEDQTDTFLDKEAGISCAEFTQSAVEKDLLPSGTANMNANGLRELFISEELFAYQVGGFENAILKEQSDIDFGITWNPRAPDGENSGFSGGIFYTLPRGSENQDEAFALIEHLMQLKWLNQYAQLPPVRPDGLQSFFEGTTDGIGRDVSNIFIEEVSNSGFPTIHVNQSRMWEAQRREIQEIILGQKTAEEAMTSLADRVRELL
jgi:fructooligosaccharide transport system substrate-binding protein